MFEQNLTSEALTVTTVTSQDQITQKPLRDLYELVLAEVEQPLLDTIMQYTRGNQTRAATMMGINRGTLRKKLKKYGMN